MAALNWTNYVALGTGVIGAISGIAGSILGYIGYKNSNNLKTLDLRMSLRNNFHDVRLLIDTLPNLIETADRSKTAVAAATSGIRTGGMAAWKMEVETDTRSMAELSGQVPSSDDDFGNLSRNELETALADMHRIHVTLNQLKSKYEQSIEADEVMRRDIRRAHQPRI